MSNAIPTPEDIKVGELKLLLKNHLKIEVVKSYLGGGNQRLIRVLFDGEEVATTTFNITPDSLYSRGGLLED